MTFCQISKMIIIATYWQQIFPYMVKQYICNLSIMYTTAKY